MALLRDPVSATIGTCPLSRAISSLLLITVLARSRDVRPQNDRATSCGHSMLGFPSGTRLLVNHVEIPTSCAAPKRNGAPTH